MFLAPFRALRLDSTLCTAFYAPVRMLLRGGKTVEQRESCQLLTFIYSYFCMLRMFLTFTYLFSCRCRSDDVYGTSPWIWFAVDATVRDFRECFEKSLYGRNLLLTIQNLSFLSFHGTSDSPPMKGLFVCECVCVCGEMYLLLVRGVSRSKTLIPLILVTIRLDAFYYNNK